MTNEEKYLGKIRSLRRAAILGILGMSLIYGSWTAQSCSDLKKINKLKSQVSQLEKEVSQKFTIKINNEIPEPSDTSVTYTSNIEITNQEKSYTLIPVQGIDKCYIRKKDNSKTK
jgi:hypothetical protein